MEVSFVLPEAVMMIYGLSVMMVTLFAVFYFVMRRSLARLGARMDMHADAIQAQGRAIQTLAAPKKPAAKKKAPAKRATKKVQPSPAQPAANLGSRLHERLGAVDDPTYPDMVVAAEDLK